MLFDVTKARYKTKIVSILPLRSESLMVNM